MAERGAKSYVNSGILNGYTLKPKNLTQYTAFRGVTDFTQVAQFDPFETGYSFLSVIQMPKFLTELAKHDVSVKNLVYSFKHALEYRFRGLTGLPNIETGTGTISDGINELNFINRVTMDTSVQISMNYYETKGSLIEKMCEYYITGIKDRMTQAKTYHGLIKNNILEPGMENEMFTFLYYVTDNTMLRLERAWLLANCQITSAPTSQYDSTRGDISNPDVTVTFNCFPIMGYEVDKAANVLLKTVTGVFTADDGNNNITYRVDSEEGQVIGQDPLSGANITTATLDSNNYRYGIMDPDDVSGTAIPALTEAIQQAGSEYRR